MWKINDKKVDRCPMEPSRRDNYSKQIAEVETLIKNNKNNEAISLLIDIENKYPQRTIAYQKHAYILAKKKRSYAEALAVLEMCKKNCVRDFNSQKSILKLYAESLSHVAGNENNAEEIYKKLIEGSEGIERIKILNSYADFCVRKGKLKEAQTIYRSIIKEAPGDKRALIDLARSYRIVNDYDNCLNVLSNETCNTDPYAVMEKIHCYVEMGDSSLATKTLDELDRILSKLSGRDRENINRKSKILKVATHALKGYWKESIQWLVEQPSAGMSVYIWKCVLNDVLLKGEINECLDYLLSLFEKYQDKTIIPHQCFHIFVASNLNEQERSKYVDKMYKTSPNNFSVMVLHAMYKQQESSKYWEECWNTYQQNYNKLDKHIIKWYALLYAQFLRRCERFEDAIIKIEEITSLVNIVAWDIELEKAVNLSRLGSYDDAYEILDRVSNYQPNNPVVLDQLGICLRATGRLEEAYEVFTRKQKIQPDAHGKSGLAKTLYDLGKFEEALSLLYELVQLQPDDVEAKFLIAEILKESGKLDEAEKYLQDINPNEIIEKGLSTYVLERKLIELQREKINQLAELEDAKKLSYLGTMATATAHELNQPVGIIRATIDAALLDIKDGYLKFDDVKPLLERLWEQANRLSKIIDNFRSFSRGDRVYREKVDINEIVKFTVTTFNEQFSHRNIELVVKYFNSSPSPIAWVNPYQIEEVIINLLANARDAVERKKSAKVWVEVFRRKGGACGFIIKDNGPGLPEEYRKKMFVPFVSTKSTEKGTGLGLYISSRIIQNSGGRLRYSDRDGGGACFVIEFPAMKGR